MTSWMRRDDGSLSLFTAILAAGLVMAAAFTADAAQKLDAAVTARGLAAEAARAGTGQISQQAAYSGNGPLILDPAAAAAAARAWLSQEGHTGSVTVTGTDTVQVTVTVTEPAAFPGLLGFSALSATETATATLTQHP